MEKRFKFKSLNAYSVVTEYIRYELALFNKTKVGTSGSSFPTWLLTIYPANI